MAIIRVTKEFSFEMAHTLTGYDGACSEIHGHSYRLFVTVKGEPEPDPSSPKSGMVMDFGVLKNIVNELITHRYDHAFVIRATESNEELVKCLKGRFSKIEVVDYQPTCENMVVRFAEQIREKLPKNISLHKVKLHETATSFAEWVEDDNAGGLR